METALFNRVVNKELKLSIETHSRYEHNKIIPILIIVARANIVLLAICKAWKAKLWFVAIYCYCILLFLTTGAQNPVHGCCCFFFFGFFLGGGLQLVLQFT